MLQRLIKRNNILKNNATYYNHAFVAFVFQSVKDKSA